MLDFCSNLYPEKLDPCYIKITFMCFLVTISVYFYFIHNAALKNSDTLSFALLACVILHINGKQFRCSVFTFVQYITYTAITDLKAIE